MVCKDNTNKRFRHFFYIQYFWRIVQNFNILVLLLKT